MARIVFTSGPLSGKTFELGDETTIGRSPKNTIPIPDPRLSRTHARIEKQLDAYHLTDMGAAVGIHINGNKTQEHVLKSRDEVALSPEVKFRFETADDLVFHDEAQIAAGRTDQFSPSTIMRSIDELDKTTFSTEPHATEDDLLAARRHIEALYRTARVVSSILDLEPLLEKIVEITMDVFNAGRGFLMLHARRKGKLEPRAVCTRGDGEAKIKISNVILKAVTDTRIAICSPDTQTDPRFSESRTVREEGVTSIMCTPLVTGDHSVGFLYLDTKEESRHFTADDLDLLVALGQQAAIAISNAQRYIRVERRGKALSRRYESDRKIIGASKEVQNIHFEIAKLAPTDLNVLITGDTGTGKELVAVLLHEKSPRRLGPFVAINCAAMPENLLENELFGHEAGAFTDASTRKEGCFEASTGGTLFLDEVGEMSLATQSKLLRVLEERSFRRLGGTEPVFVDVRVITATNKNLEELVRDKRFREDLFYRLAVASIDVPPLRERAGDIPLLAEHFMKAAAVEMGRAVQGITEAAMSILTDYDWPGNIRELRNVMEGAIVLLEGDKVDVTDLPPHFRERRFKARVRGALDSTRSLPEVLGETERLCIIKALETSGGKKVEAAKLLGVSRPTLDKKLGEFGIDISTFKGNKPD
ncbi:MAG: sigma 54-interacting transcriptional regulator [Planctomycetota bacterium]|jgi:Nif-specific regulatory protein